YGGLLVRLRDIPGPAQPLGNFSRESMMWLGQLVFMLMCALTAVGMSAPLITRLFGPASNVQTSYYNPANAPLAIALGPLLGIAPLVRWRRHDVPRPALLLGVGVGLVNQIALLVLKHAPGDVLWWVIGSVVAWAVAALLVFVPAAISSVGAAMVLTVVAAIL